MAPTAFTPSRRGRACASLRFVPLQLLTLAVAAAGAAQTVATNIVVTNTVIHSDVRHFGINLSGQTYYDSGQMMRNLIFRNPGFEGETWRTVLQCKFVKGNSCSDSDEWSGWPANFARGAAFEFISGAAMGETGTVESSTTAASSAKQGIWVSFGALKVPPRKGDVYILRMSFPGNAASGWWPSTSGGGTLGTEFHDLSKASPGKQALRLSASAPGQSAGVTSNFDTWEGRSFLQLNGVYTLKFRAKGIEGADQLNLSVARLTNHGTINYLHRTVPLVPEWQDYSFPFDAKEDGTVNGAVQVSFSVAGSSALLDDAALIEAAGHDNPTDFRDAVVRRLRELKPGVLRYMDNGTNFGSTLDDLIAVPFARRRAGYSEGATEQDDIPIGLHEFLVLCQAVKAEPWFVVPAGLSVSETQHLIEYLAGPATGPSKTDYGAKRAARGQAAPWTQVFPVIHLELGNETWNWGSFPGEAIPDPIAYATRVSTIFAAARSSHFYDPLKFDLIMDGWSAVPWYTQQEVAQHPHADTVDIAPYLFNSLNDAGSTEAIFGPMFAEPEALDSRPGGQVAAQAKIAADAGVKLAAYEVNLSTTQGSVSQNVLDSVVPSLGAGLAVADHMLLMLRDGNVALQCLFGLPEFENQFNNTSPGYRGPREYIKLWGSVVDMGGETDRVRPTFLAEALANSAIAPQMIKTVHAGPDPTWEQRKSANGDIQLSQAHDLQSFAFTDGKRCSLILFNLDRRAALSVTFSGPAAPRNLVHISRLTSANINDTNEDSQKVVTKGDLDRSFDPGKPYSLSPHSMTVLTWEVSGVRFVQ